MENVSHPIAPLSKTEGILDGCFVQMPRESFTIEDVEKLSLQPQPV